MRRLFMVSVIGVCACGGNGSGGDDDDDAVAVRLESHCQAASDLNLVDTQLGQTSVGLVLATSVHGDSLANLAVSIDGPNAGELATSVGCPAEDFCQVQVSLTPTSMGVKAATVHIGDQAVSVHATAIAAGSAFTSLANLDLVAAPLLSSGGSFTLSNLGAAPITLDPATTTNGTNAVVATGYQDCPLPITQGGVCTIGVSIVQLDSGCVDATAHVTSNVGNFDIPIASQLVTIAAGQTVASVDGGHGRVTSDVGGMDCRGGGDGSRCAAHIDASSVTFTAVPDADSVFNGWADPACGMSPTCTYAVDALHRAPNARADFAPNTARAIHVTLAGDATGFIQINDKVCSSSCTVYVADGRGASVNAIANSQFGGYTGACTGTSRHCDLGTIVNDRDLTATFTKDVQEVSSTTAPVFGTARYLAGGDLIVVSSLYDGISGAVVTRLTPSGDTVWNRFVVGSPVAQAITATGNVYVVVGNELTRVGSDGALQWRVSVTLPALSPFPLAAAGEDVVLGITNGLEIHAAADGSVTRTLTTTGTPGAVAVASDGTIAASLGDELDRFDASGAALPIITLPSFPSGFSDSSLAYDATGVLFALRGSASDLGAGAKLSRIAANATVTYTVDLDTTGGSAGGTTGGGAIAIASDGTVVTFRTHRPQFYPIAAGGFVEAYDNATGARKWQLDKQGANTGPGAAVTGFVAGTLLVPATGVQLLGVRNDTDRLPVLETLSL